jgi:putative peptidoglycan lipid II flippase
MANPALTASQKSANWRIFGALLTVGSFTALAKIGGGAKVIVTARYFGTSDALDAFLIAFVLPSFVADTAAGSLIPSLMPTYIEVRQKQGRETALRLYRGVLAGSAILLALLAVLLGLCASFLLPLLASGFSPAKLALTRSLFYCLLPWLPLSGLIVTWRAVLNAGESFALAAAAPITTPLITILLLITSGPSVWALAIGTLVGVAAEAAILACSVRSRGYAMMPHWSGWSPELRQVVGQYLPMMAGTVIVCGAALIDQAMAATLGAGSVSALTYGNKLANVALSIGAAALGTAVLPHFSRMITARDGVGLRNTLMTFSGLVAVATVPAVIFLAWLSEPLVRLFFQRGAFTAAETQIVATVQTCSLVQIPFAVLLGMAVKLASSLKANRLMLQTALLSIVVNVAGDIVLMRWIGVAGIALAGALVHASALLLLSMALWRQLRKAGF